MGYTAVQNTDCYLSPMSTRLLNSISSRICRENTQFNMYTTTSKQQEGCTFKDSHPKCFITTNFDKFHREAFARAVNRGDVLTVCFRDIATKSIRMAFVIITPPARRAWRSYKFAPFLFFSFFPVSKVGAPLMGDTAVHSLSHDFKLNF